MKTQIQPIPGRTQPADTAPLDGNRSLQSPYLTSREAAKYLRKSESWILKQADVPYLKGAPNLYKKQDLDDWFERHKFRPSIN